MERLTFAVSGGKVEGRTLSGTAHVYGTVTTDGRNHAFKPGAFGKSLEQAASFAWHDTTKPLGTVEAGTVRLIDGPDGLQFAIDTPETTYADDMRAYVAAGNKLGMSVAILPGKSVTRGGVKTWQSARLLSVDPVAMPAFEGTSVVLSSAQPETALSATIKIRARALANRARVAPSEKPTPSGDPKPRV